MATNNVVNVSPALALTGGTMTGALILDADPTAANEGATKQYADAAAGGFGLGAISGNWYVSGGGIFYQVNGAPTPDNMSTGLLTFLPFMVTKNNTYTEIGVLIGSTASGNVALGLYNSGVGVCEPDGNPIAGSESGDLASAANSFISYTFPTPISLSPGLYWCAFSVSATNSIYGRNTGPMSNGMGTNSPSLSAGLQAGWTQPFTHSGTFPAVGTLTGIYGIASAAARNIYICMRAQ